MKVLIFTTLLFGLASCQDSTTVDAVTASSAPVTSAPVTSAPVTSAHVTSAPDAMTTDHPNDFTCEFTPTKVVEIACWGYKECVNGVPNVVMCPQGQTLERDTMSCVTTGNTDCTKDNDCSSRPDGSYADLGDNCQTYFRCVGGKSLGHLYCPANLVFDETLGICNFPDSVPLCKPISVGK